MLISLQNWLKASKSLGKTFQMYESLLESSSFGISLLMEESASFGIMVVISTHSSGIKFNSTSGKYIWEKSLHKPNKSFKSVIFSLTALHKAYFSFMNQTWIFSSYLNTINSWSSVKRYLKFSSLLFILSLKILLAPLKSSFEKNLFNFR